MAYGSGSGSGSGFAPPSQDHSGEQYDPTMPVYEDIELGDQDEAKHVTPSLSAITSGGFPVNQHSRSIEKRHRKNKQVYKSDVVMQMWQKVFNKSK